MILNRITKIAIILTVAVLLAAAVFYVYFFHFHLPSHLRRQLLPELLGDADLQGFSGELRRVGAMGAELGELIVGDKERPALHVRSVDLQYRLRDFLWTNRLSVGNVNVRGVELRCRLHDDGRLLINDLAVADFLALPEKHFGDKHRSQIARLLAKATINVRDGMLALEWHGEELTLPFTLNISPPEKNWSRIEATFRARLHDRNINGGILVDTVTGEVKMDIDGVIELGEALRLVGNSPQFKMPPGLTANGSADVAGQFNFKLKPVQAGDYDLRLTVGSGELRHGGLWLRNRMLPSGRQIPAILDISRKNGRLAARLENVFCHKPLPVTLNELNLEIPSDRLLPVVTNGGFAVDLAQFRFLQYYGIQPAGDVGVEKRFSGRFSRADGSWSFSAESQREAKPSSERYVFSRDGLNFFCDFSNLEIAGSGVGFAGDLTFQGGIEALNVVAERTAFSGSKGNFRADFKLTTDQRGELSAGENTFELYLPQLFYFCEKYRLTASKLRLGGGTATAEDIPVAMRFQLECDEFAVRGEDVAISGERLDIASNLTRNPQSALWGGKLRMDSGNFSGRHESAIFDVRDVDVKCSFTATRPELNPDVLRMVNARVAWSDGGYGTESIRARAEGAELALSMELAQPGVRLMDKTLTGDFEVIRLLHGDCALSLWKPRWFGSLRRGQTVDDAAAGSDFLERIEADKTEFSSPLLKLVAGSGVFRFEGRLQPDRLFPAACELSVALPTLWALGDDSKIRADQVDVALSGKFSEATSARSPMRGVGFTFKSGQVSGNIGTRKFSGDTASSRVDAKIAPKDSGSNGLTVEHLDGAGEASRLAFADAAGNAEVAKLTFSCKGGLDDRGGINLFPSVVGKQLHATWNGRRGNVPEIRLHGSWASHGFAGELSGSEGWLLCDKTGLRFNRLDFQIPLATSPQAAPLRGNLTIGEIAAKQAALGSAIVNLSNDGSEFRFDGELHSQMLAAAPIVSGGVMLPFLPLRWHASFVLPQHTTVEPLQPGRYFPELDGIFFNGTAAVSGQFSGNERDVAGQMTVELENSELRLRDWAFTGVSGACRFDDLFGLRSVPRQELEFRRLEHQRYAFENGRVRMQIVSPQSVYIEHARFNWLDGELHALSPFYLGTGSDKDKSAVFQADRVRLEPLLDFLGIGGEASETTLSGKLRQTVSGGRLRLTDAELVTEAGVAGNLKLPGIERFANPADTGTDESGKLDFAQEALRDFRYNWLRLRFSGNGSGRNVRLETSGSPAEPIPFRFDVPTGSFVRSHLGEARFSGNVVLESEFNLPVEQ